MWVIHSLSAAGSEWAGGAPARDADPVGHLLRLQHDGAAVGIVPHVRPQPPQRRRHAQSCAPPHRSPSRPLPQAAGDDVVAPPRGALPARHPLPPSGQLAPPEGPQGLEGQGVPSQAQPTIEAHAGIAFPDEQGSGTSRCTPGCLGLLRAAGAEEGGGGGGMSSRPPDLGPEWVCLVGREGGSPVALPGTKSSPTSPPCCRLWSWGPGRPSLRPRSQARASETAAVQGTPPRIGAGGAGEQAAAIFPAPGRLPAHEWRRRGAAQHAATCGTIELERLRHMRDG